MEKVYIKTLGCKVNTFDSHAIENQFIAATCTLVKEAEDADIAIVNTCSVTANAEKEARYLARRFRRSSPDSLIVMTGCYAQTDSKRLSEMSEIDLVVPNETKTDLVPFVLAQLDAKRKGLAFAKVPENTKLVSENKQSHFKSSLTLFDKANSQQTRGFVKIQDGCNGFCSYCLIPYARGASRSVKEDVALDEIRRLVSSGSKEIVLTGIHIGDYGMDHVTQGEIIEDGRPFVEFMKRVFDIDGLERVRISSLEPAELTKPLIEVLAQNKDRFCDHFHLPLQAGSDRILKLMRRKYTKQRYLESCEMAKSYFPNVCLGADIIPGFPSETAEEFEETLQFIKECSLHYLHVFPYSKRPNTAAEKMPNHIDQAVIKERAFRLRELSRQLKKDYIRRFIGSTLSVLWENEVDELGRRVGLTKNYLSIVNGGASDLANQGASSKMLLRGFVGEERLLGVPSSQSDLLQ